MADSFDHCEELVRTGDKNRFLATLFAPQKYRRALYALYAFNLEVARTRELAREPMPGEIRLQWWRDVLGGAGRGEIDAHPVAAALRDVVVRYRLSPKVLLELRSDVKKAEAREKHGRIEKLAFGIFAWMMTHPRIYEMAGKIAAAMAPSDGGWIRTLPAPFNIGPVAAWISQRDLPPPPPRSFRDMWRKR